LRLADILEHKIPSIACLEIAAKELRRQHEEIKCEERRFGELWEQFAALDKTNQELLEVLKAILHFNGSKTPKEVIEQGEAAIAKAEVQA
jgi:hypothetical protein